MPPAELDACVQEVLAKDPSLDESNAYAICHEQLGKVAARSAAGSNVSLYEDNNRLYLKAFLLDGSININEWGVTQSSLAKNINTFIGKPLVLTEDFSHPVPAEYDSLDHWLAYQEIYRIGTIIDVVPGPRAYYALIEVTDADAKKALQSGAIPNYVSPAIAQSVTDPALAIENWTGVHLAIVDDPAFTVKKATITASCGGDSEKCLMQLRKAKIVQNKDKTGCGFCNYKVLMAKFGAYARIAAFTSHDTFSSKNKTAKMTEDTNVSNTPVSAPTQQETTTTTKEDTVPKSQYDEALRKLADAELKAKELSETNKSMAADVAEIKHERRREKIERIITAEIIKDDQKRTEKINTMVASTIPVKDIEDLYRDVIIVRKASVDIGTIKPHVTLNSNDSSNEDEKTILARKLGTVAGVL